MTYAEKITYLVGNDMELVSYVLRNAYRVVCLTEGLSKRTPAVETEGLIASEESRALALVTEKRDAGTEALLSFIQGKGLSEKEETSLVKVLHRRDYLLSLFFLDNAKAIAREEVAVYESIIKELNEYLDEAKSLNQSLSKSADRILASYRE
jgi:hypothetical protein